MGCRAYALQICESGIDEALFGLRSAEGCGHRRRCQFWPGAPKLLCTNIFLCMATWGPLLALGIDLGRSWALKQALISPIRIDFSIAGDEVVVAETSSLLAACDLSGI